MMQNDELMELEAEDEEFDVASENIISPFEAKDIDIAVEQNSLSTIIGMIKDDAIDMNTEFQRSGYLLGFLTFLVSISLFSWLSISSLTSSSSVSFTLTAS